MDTQLKCADKYDAHVDRSLIFTFIAACRFQMNKLAFVSSEVVYIVHHVNILVLVSKHQLGTFVML
jgi:hypothetical protein